MGQPPSLKLRRAKEGRKQPRDPFDKLRASSRGTGRQLAASSGQKKLMSCMRGRRDRLKAIPVR